MPRSNAGGVLKDIPVSKIDRNPENPRIHFRQKELDELAESIRRHGVQVPISVFQEAGRYVLIDGERRWKCCLKLNRRTIPAIIQDKPDALTNLVLMFNIHALREQWDLLTIALKLPRVIELYSLEKGRTPNERELSEETGLPRGTIRRCRLLMNLPDHHLATINAELRKPKSAQKVTEDFYIEMERALSAVSRYMPDVLPNERARERARQTLLDKYRGEVISNIVDFRKLSKIARAPRVEADTQAARTALELIFEPNDYSINDGYDRSVSDAYLERDLLTHIESLLTDLRRYRADAVDREVQDVLHKLISEAQRLLEASE